MRFLRVRDVPVASAGPGQRSPQVSPDDEGGLILEIFSLRALAAWLLPPAGPLVLAMVGLLLWHRPAGRWLAVAGVLLLYLFSIPPVGYALMAPLQTPYEPPDDPVLVKADAIVVLGAGYRSGAAEFSGETVNDLALVRLRYAAVLHRRTGLPVIASGGAAKGREPEARWMAEVLEEFGVSSILREDRSRDTRGNALHSARLLREAGLERPLLVTQAHHLPRAIRAFEQAGVEVIPAPTGAFIAPDNGMSPGVFRPRASALRMSWLAMHEYLGIQWYRWRSRDRPATPANAEQPSGGREQGISS